MKKWIAVLFVFTFLLGLGTVSVSAQNQKRTPEENFARMDKNGDKKLSLEEFVGRREGEKADRAKENFKKLDKDNDGFLTLDEFKAGQKKA
jgi:Ca2+-binding EF-hand superfamily protein